jgi:hypothetical protein
MPINKDQNFKNSKEWDYFIQTKNRGPNGSIAKLALFYFTPAE